MRGTTTTSTARMKARTPPALPHQIAARGMGETSRPTSADSSRSRCQVRPSASTDENTTASQSAPGATRVVVCGPVAKATLARMATSAAKNAAVVTISRVATSMRRSFRKTAIDPRQNPGKRLARLARPCGEFGRLGQGIGGRHGEGGPGSSDGVREVRRGL